jgi:hypothetical protein
MIARGRLFGTLAERLRGVDPYQNVLRSIDYVNAGGDATARPEMRESFVEAERREQEASGRPPPGRVDFTRSAGPVAERLLLSSDPVAVIMGPRGSAKTTEIFKKVAFEGQGIRPGPDGKRRYEISTWREKYVNQWDATIPSWWKLFPADLSGSQWNGSKPHPATHVLRFDDEFGSIEITNRFRAFGDSADSDDTLGNESTDVVLNQIDTLPEQLFTWLGAVIGRSPPRNLLYPDKPDDFVYGKIFGDMNAPTPISWLYRDFIEAPKPGHVLYRQPGGLEPDAENLHVVGRGYYRNLARMNAHRKWWVNINVHNKPGFRRDTDVVYPDYDDDRMVSKERLNPVPELPVLVGIDGGLTPAAAYWQEMSNGQARLLAEIQLQRGGVEELGDAMLALEAARFRGCDFIDRCDPAMRLGEDTENSSDRARLSKRLGRKVELAVLSKAHNADARWEPLRAKMKLNVAGGEPGVLIDPSCILHRRGWNGSYRFHHVQGTTDRSRVATDICTHLQDASQVAAFEFGTAHARRRIAEKTRAREERRKAAREFKRFNPLKRRRV